MKYLKNLLALIVISHYSSAELLTCDYIRHSDGYNCEVKSSYSERKEITAVNGSHKYGKGDSDVEVLYITDSNSMAYIPTNICQHFTNLIKFDIYGSQIKELNGNIFKGCDKIKKVVMKYAKVKTIEENFLAELKALSSLTMTFTSIEVIPKSFFANNPQLSNLEMSYNKFKIFAADFPDNITSVSMVNNECIDAQFDSRSPRSMSLADFRKKLYLNCIDASATTPRPTDDNDLKFTEIENKISKLETKLKSLETELEDDVNEVKTKQEFSQIRMKTLELTSSNQDGALKSHIEKYTKSISELTDKIRLANIKLDETKNFESENSKTRAELNKNGNILIGLFVVQLITIAFIIFSVVYLKFYQTPYKRGQSLISEQGNGHF
jgi:Leucine-rich repeat (LRR) protein